MSLTVFELMATSRPVARPAHGGKITNGKKFCCRELGGGGQRKKWKIYNSRRQRSILEFCRAGGHAPSGTPSLRAWRVTVWVYRVPVDECSDAATTDSVALETYGSCSIMAIEDKIMILNSISTSVTTLHRRVPVDRRCSVLGYYRNQRSSFLDFVTQSLWYTSYRLCDCHA